MDTAAVLFAAVILLPAVGVVAWAWFLMAQVEEDVRALSAFEGRHVDV